MSDATGANDRAEQGEGERVADENATPEIPTTIVKTPPSKTPTEARHLQRADVGDVEAATVVMERSGAEQITAERVTLTQSGVKQLDARSAQLDRSGVITLKSERAVLQDSSALVVAADDARLVKGRAGMVVAGQAHMEAGSSALVVMGPVSGEGRPVVDERGAIAFGAAFAAVLLILGRILRRGRGGE